MTTKKINKIIDDLEDIITEEGVIAVEPEPLEDENGLIKGHYFNIWPGDKFREKMAQYFLNKKKRGRKISEKQKELNKNLRDQNIRVFLEKEGLNE